MLDSWKCLYISKVILGMSQFTLCQSSACLAISWSVWQSYSANVPIPATLVLSHTKFWLPELHQLESHSDIRVSLLRLQAVPDQSSNFSPLTCSSQSPTYSLDWVTLHDFSVAFKVTRCQAGWLWSMANLKSLMLWNRGLLQVQSLDNNKIVFGSIQAQSLQCLPFSNVLCWTLNRVAGMQLDPFKIIWQLRLSVF